MNRIGWHLLGFARPRCLRCRVGAHLWSIMCDPIQCLRCHAKLTDGKAQR